MSTNCRVWMHYLSLFKWMLDSMLINALGNGYGYTATADNAQVLENYSIQDTDRGVGIAVIAAYVDQAISTNTFYNPAHFADRKVPTTLIAKNLMQAHRWGIKTFYYSLINKQGSKGTDDPAVITTISESDSDLLEEDCLACKL